MCIRDRHLDYLRAMATRWGSWRNNPNDAIAMQIVPTGQKSATHHATRVIENETRERRQER
eukprot:5348005-Pyramimonas_sp.AAC.1